VSTPTSPEPLDLDAIEAKAAEATTGPWVPELTLIDGPRASTYGRYSFPVALPGSGSRDPDADMVFIAAARSDVPALVAEVRRLRADLDTAHDALDGTRDYLRECGDRKIRIERERDALRAAIQAAEADAREWRDAALAAKGHYEQSDARLAAVEVVCADAETMQWADVSQAYGEGVRAMAGWVRTAATAMPDTPRPALAAAGVGREDTEQPLDEVYVADLKAAVSIAATPWADEVGDTGQADEPQRQWGGQLQHMPDPYKAAAGQVVPQQPCVRCGMSYTNICGATECPGYRRPGLVGQDTTGEQQQ
jgi:hypothetical protein